MATLARILLTGAVLTGCGTAPAAPVSNESRGSEELATTDQTTTQTSPAGADAWFTDQAEATGLRFVHFNGMSGDYHFPEMIPAGVGLFDYDNDGDLDAYFVQGRMLGDGKALDAALFPPTPPGIPTGRLYRNDLRVGEDGARTLEFTDVTAQSGIDAGAYGMGIATGDIDNDGWVDLYLTNYGPNQLLRNNGDGTFTDVSNQSGTDDSAWGVSASFLDYDRDGWIDLYVGNYVQYDTNANQQCTGLTGMRDYCTPEMYAPQPDRLFRNQGQGRFIDVTGTALVGGAPFGPALGVSTADFTNDGWTDIYVTNDGRENLLWINQGDGTFENMGPLSGSSVNVSGEPEGSMGVDAGDFDNDGDDDLLVTHLPAEGNNLYVNNGKGLFEDLSVSSGVGLLSLRHTGFGTAFLDFDNDGWLDIIALNGAIEAIRGRPDDPFPYGERNLLFRNLHDGRFSDVTDQAGPVFELLETSRGAAFGDIDNDGDTDALVSNVNAPARLLINHIGHRNHWVGLSLANRTSPHDVLGARIEVIRSDQPTLWRRARADGSYASAHDPRVVVGLGDSSTPPTVRVHWPGGDVDEWPGLALDRWTTLTQGDGDTP
jgi:hypothetical protein